MVYPYGERMVKVPEPLEQRPGVETLEVVSNLLWRAITEFGASPDRRQWPGPMAMASALVLEHKLDALHTQLLALRHRIDQDLNDEDDEDDE